MKVNEIRILSRRHFMVLSVGLGMGLFGAEFGDYMSGGDFNLSGTGVIREFELTAAYSVGTMNLSGGGFSFSGNGKLQAGVVNDASSLGEETILSGVDWTIGALNMANSTASSHWVLSQGARVEVTGAWKMFNDKFGTARIGALEVTDKSYFRAKGDNNLGIAAKTTNCVVRLLVDDSTLEVPNAPLKLAEFTPYAYLDIRHGGTVRVNGISTRTGAKATDCTNKNYGHPTSETRITLDDGTLEVGGSGLLTGAAEPLLPTLDLRHGTFRTTANWTPPAGATAQWPQIAFGSDLAAPGQLTFDTNGKSIEFWPVVGGCSEVTLTGGGSIATTNYLQGVVMGKWTVDAGVEARLDAFSGFAGGLELAPDAQASIRFGGGESCVDAGPLSHVGKKSMLPYLSTGPLPLIVDNLDFAHQRNNPAFMKYTSFVYRGEFYVETGKEGTWYFGGTFDNGLYFEVDHQKVLEPSDWGMVDAGSINLSVGWHPFTLICYSANGKSGPLDIWDEEGFEDGEIEREVLSWGLGRISVGWALEPPADPKDPGYYTRFDMHSLRMRRTQLPAGSRPTSVRWAAKRGLDPDWDAHDGEYATLVGFYPYFANGVTNTLQCLNEPGSWSEGIGCTSRFTGYFQVDASDAGTWNFTGRYPDRISLRIDGTRILATETPGSDATGSCALTAGWHAFEIRCVNDPDSAVSNSMRDDAGRSANLLAVLPSGARRVFDERSFRIAINAFDAGTEKGCGLGGVVKLNPGSRFTNRAESGYCPIYGRLEGTGTLEGPFAFTAEAEWAINGVADQLQVPSFVDPSPRMFADLRKIELTLDCLPKQRSYWLGPALGLTVNSAARIEVDITVAGADEATAAEYRHFLRAAVQDGQLVLIPHFKGFVILLQ